MHIRAPGSSVGMRRQAVALIGTLIAGVARAQTQNISTSGSTFVGDTSGIPWFQLPAAYPVEDSCYVPFDTHDIDNSRQSLTLGAPVGWDVAMTGPAAAAAVTSQPSLSSHSQQQCVAPRPFPLQNTIDWFVGIPSMSSPRNGWRIEQDPCRTGYTQGDCPGYQSRVECMQLGTGPSFCHWVCPANRLGQRRYRCVTDDFGAFKCLTDYIGADDARGMMWGRPVVADINSDGLDDLISFRPATWLNYTARNQSGSSGWFCELVVGYCDGVGGFTEVVDHPWWLQTTAYASFRARPASPEDPNYSGVVLPIVVPMDYNNDGSTDLLLAGNTEVFVLMFNNSGFSGEICGTLPPHVDGIERDRPYVGADWPRNGNPSGAAADFDGDGHIDLVLVYPRGTPEVLIGCGNGSFTHSSVRLSWPGGHSRRRGGVTRDHPAGFLHVTIDAQNNVVTNPTFGWWSSDKDFVWASRSVSVADVNGDSFVDIVIGGNCHRDSGGANSLRTVGSTRVFLNSGAGNFTQLLSGSLADIFNDANCAPHRHSEYAKLADFTGDGYVDVVWIQHKGRESIHAPKLFRGDGAGGFTEVKFTPSLKESTLADIELVSINPGRFINAPGTMGLLAIQAATTDQGVGLGFVLSSVETKAWLFTVRQDWPALQQETGTNSEPDIFRGGSRTKMANKYHSIDPVPGDFNEDGHLDLFVAAGTRTGSDDDLIDIFICIGDGNGGFDCRDVPDNSTVAVHAVAADFNDDSHLDVFVATKCKADGARALLNASTVYGTNNQLQAQECLSPPHNLLYIGDGRGRFAPPTAFGIRASNAWHAAAADWNSDGTPDLFITNIKMANELHLSNGFGGFNQVLAGPLLGANATFHPLQWTLTTAIAGDFNQDGYPDILLFHRPWGATDHGIQSFVNVSNQLFLGDGAGHFISAALHAAIANFWDGFQADIQYNVVANLPEEISRLKPGASVACADFDQDGRLDLFIVHAMKGDAANKPNVLFLGCSATDGYFCHRPSSISLISETRRQIIGASAADIDGDGFVDLVLTAAKQPIDSKAGTIEPWDDLVYLGGRGARFRRAPLSLPKHVVEGLRTDNGMVIVDVNADGLADIYTGRTLMMNSVCRDGFALKSAGNARYLRLCYPCPAYAIGTSSSRACRYCPDGKVGPSNAAGDPMRGWTKEQAYVCGACEAGKIRIETQQIETCEVCAAGLYAPASSSMCMTCPAGSRTNIPTQAATSCVVCIPGKYSSTNQTACESCPRGKFSTVGVCTLCNELVNEARTACTPCPLNTELDASTGLCKCKEGYYNASLGEIRCFDDATRYQIGDSARSLISDAKLMCRKCNDACIDCHYNGFAGQPILRPGFSAASGQSDWFAAGVRDVFECPMSGCVEEQPPSPATVVRQLCKPGYTGTLCAICADTHALGTGKCIKCKNFTVMSALVLVCGCLVLGSLIGAAVVLLKRNADNPALNALLKLLPDLISDAKVFLSVYQILSGMGQTMMIRYPAAVETFIDQVRGFANVDVFSVPSMACILGSSFYGKFWVAVLTPPAIVVVMLCLFHARLRSSRHHMEGIVMDAVATARWNNVQGVAKANLTHEYDEGDKRWKSTKHATKTAKNMTQAEAAAKIQAAVRGQQKRSSLPQRPSRVIERLMLQRAIAMARARQSAISWTFFLIFLAYPSICSKTFAIFHCLRVDDNTSLLMADFTEQCSGAKYVVHAIIAAVAICLYAIGIPLGVGFLIYRQRGAIACGSGPSELESMYKDYKPDSCLWEVYQMLQKVFLVGIIGFVARGSLAQTALGLLVTQCVLLAFVQAQPYNDRRTNILAAIGQSILAFSYLSTILLKADHEGEVLTQQTIGYLVNSSFTLLA
jgi:hypothetical protein